MSGRADAALRALQGRSILLLGFGREGRSTYRFLRAHVPGARVAFADRLGLAEAPDETRALVADDPGLEVLAEAEVPARIGRDFDVVFRSPGIPPDVPALAPARSAGVNVTSNTALFLALCPGTVVGITGTKGKSTTAGLTHEVLRAAGIDSRLLGNIGTPPLAALDLESPNAVYVAELSSHQLADLGQSPQVAVVLDVVPEHQDYYPTFPQYLEAKANITRHQRPDDHVAYNAGSATAARLAGLGEATAHPFGLDPTGDVVCTLEGEWIVLRRDGGSQPVLRVPDIPLRGRFNLVNVLAATTVGTVLGAGPEEIALGVRRFKGLDHRLQHIGSVGGVDYFDDSLATVPEATLGALDSFSEPVVLIAGGEDRGQDFGPLAAALSSGGLRGLVLLPPSGERLQAALSGNGAYRFVVRAAQDMDEAVALAAGMALPGDIVLLSPASASHGMFRDYADRGQRFRAAVASVASAS